MESGERERERLLAECDRLRAENERLKSERTVAPATIHGLSEMALQIDAGRVVRYVNTAMARFIGRPREDIVGRPLRDFDDSPFGIGLLDLMIEQASLEGTTVETEREFLDPATGRPRFLAFRAVQAGGLTHLVISDRSEFHILDTCFRRYVSPQVIDRLVRGGYDFARPRRTDLTVLFADLRDFTRLTAGIPIDETKGLLDSFLNVMTGTVMRAGGTVDKIMGDGVMALFGAPVDDPDHPLKAVSTGLAMQAEHHHLTRAWRARGWPAPLLGVGICAGEALVGNLGGQHRMDYTAIGPCVNLAARLCAAARGGEVLMDEATFRRCTGILAGRPEAAVEPLKFVRGRGVAAKGFAGRVATVAAVALGEAPAV